jgi:hypothetical protein
MREMKFRAWNPKFNKMEHDVWPTSKDTVGHWIKMYGRDEWQFSDNGQTKVIIEQYIGPKDKNGKEICYDSDIVEYTYQIDNDAERSEEVVTGTVVLDLKFTNSLCVKTEGGGLYHFTPSECRNIEIIGTIHDKEADHE